MEAAAEVAGYILDTGDEGTVVTFLEELLNERKVGINSLTNSVIQVVLDYRGGSSCVCRGSQRTY